MTGTQCLAPVLQPAYNEDRPLRGEHTVGHPPMASRVRRALGLAVVVVALVAGIPGSARAVSLHDLMALSRAGLSDGVLIALIQSDRTIYGVDASQILALKRAGVSDPVIVALLRNGREPATAATPSGTPAPAQPAASPAAPPAPARAATGQESGASGSTVPGLVIIGDHGSEPAPATATQVVVMPVPGIYLAAVAGRASGGRARHCCASSSRFGRVGRTGLRAPGVTGQVGALPNGFIGTGRMNAPRARGIQIRGAFVDGVHIQNPVIIGAHVRGQWGGHR